MGLDFQMVWWPDGFCQALADRGFHVARFDNRGTGLSTHFQSPQRENPFRVLLRGSRRPPYTGADMVADGISVMDALGWQSAHVFGMSMGSALAVTTAVLHPQRVRSVTAGMGGPLRPSETWRYLKFGLFFRAARIKHPATDEGAIQTLIDLVRLLGSPHHPFDEEWARGAAEISHARAPRDPGTTQRHTAALRSTGLLQQHLWAPIIDEVVAQASGRGKD
jgi:pimeloyl-ACP methyl ester carboxylesterase